MAATKRIIVLSDGTGNAASKVWRTNVWRVFELLDLTSDEQVAKYDDGVGSSAFVPWAILTGAFGWGLKRNIIDLYKFVCRKLSARREDLRLWIQPWRLPEPRPDRADPGSRAGSLRRDFGSGVARAR